MAAKTFLFVVEKKTKMDNMRVLQLSPVYDSTGVYTNIASRTQPNVNLVVHLNGGTAFKGFLKEGQQVALTLTPL